jgi:hypothetical protein
MDPVRTDQAQASQLRRVTVMVGFVLVGFFVLIAVLSALGWVADSRETSGFFAAPYDRTRRSD